MVPIKTLDRRQTIIKPTTIGPPIQMRASGVRSETIPGYRLTTPVRGWE